MPERKKEESVKDKIKQILTDEKVHFRMPPANGYGKAGDFDFVCCVGGAYLGVEAKRDDKEAPTALQTDNAVSAARHGGVALLIHKDNLALLRETIFTMRLRMSMAQIPVNFRLGYWPEAKPQPEDNDVVVRRKKP